MTQDLSKIDIVVIKNSKGDITDRITVDALEIKNTKQTGSVLFITEKNQ